MSPAKRQKEIVFLTALIDVFAVAVSFFIAYLFRFKAGILPVDYGIPSVERYTQALIVVIPVYLWFFRAYGLYETRRHIRRIEEIFLVIKAVSFSVVSLTAITFFYRAFAYSRIYSVVLWATSLLTVSLCRYLLIQWEYRRKLRKQEIAKVLILGANRNTRNIIQWAKDNPHYGQEVVGILSQDTASIGKHLEGVGILGNSHQYEDFINSLKPDRVVLVDTGFSRDQIADLVVTCEDQWIEFRVAADFYGLMTRWVDVENLSTVPLLGFRALPLDDVWNRVAKRTFDIVVSFILTVFTSPLWILAVFLIKCDGKGPVFYLQERVGRDQKVFNVIKFRTMRPDAEKESGPVWARKDDSRRTRFGHLLRRWNLDELPQLVNVLKGDMSLVGPRPERPHFVSQFRETIPRYMTRHKVKSGITGWAQVNGLRGNTSIQERIKYDLYYMENWSLLLDLEILFMTLFAYKNAY